MQPLQNLLFMPEHHTALAWWIALLSPLWLPPIVTLLKRLPLWGDRLRQARIDNDILLLQQLHNNSYRLLKYLAIKASSILYEIVYASFAAAMMAHFPTIPARTIAYSIGISLSSGIAGVTWRTRSVLTKLSDYDTSLASLKSEQDRYRAKHGIAT